MTLQFSLYYQAESQAAFHTQKTIARKYDNMRLRLSKTDLTTVTHQPMAEICFQSRFVAKYGRT